MGSGGDGLVLDFVWLIDLVTICWRAVIVLRWSVGDCMMFVAIQVSVVKGLAHLIID